MDATYFTRKNRYFHQANLLQHTPVLLVNNPANTVSSLMKSKKTVAATPSLQRKQSIVLPTVPPK